MDNEEQQELQDRIMRYRVMEREATDPLALGLLHDIVAELEAALRLPNRLANEEGARKGWQPIRTLPACGEIPQPQIRNRKTCSTFSVAFLAQ